MSEMDVSTDPPDAPPLRGSPSSQPPRSDSATTTRFFSQTPDPGADIETARKVLTGASLDPEDALALARRLCNATKLSYARRILLRSSKQAAVRQDAALNHKTLLKLALYTYKDRDLPADARLDRARSILMEIEDPKTTRDQEALGLYGSMARRKWELDGQRKHLEQALDYYLRGHAVGPETDQGYTSINAAFLLDQLATLEEASGTLAGNSASTPVQRRQHARQIREAIVAKVPPLLNDPNHEWVNDKWWYYSTVAEAHFGLGAYDEAVRWLQLGQTAARASYEWEAETSARQLAALAKLRHEAPAPGTAGARSPAFVTLERAFGASAVADTAFLGKLGLALSGGGFRASLYHLGVLARLAELDVLRHVEVLSCVSGGSIVGAHYYLKVRHLLQTKTDDEIEPEDYVAIVEEMIDDFLAGVQTNIRTSIAINPLENLCMLVSNRSRTQRVGELYERRLYSKVKDGGENDPRWLDKLTVAPLLTRNDDGTTSKDERFNPKYQNWRRSAKVPVLVLNAATLNTGHTWQFTATFMGESPAAIDSEIDGNERLRRIYYADAPARHQRVRLGEAVGASAAVPGVFEPITLDGLYPDRIVRLVDGGVCDNQGVVSLLEQDCKVVLVSDGSGQMDSVPAASRGAVGVLFRTNSIFQARIRQAEYHDLKGRQRAGLLNGFMFVHLKGDLEVDPVDWIGCQDRFESSDEASPPERRGHHTRYGVPKALQRLLSGIRTDLDSFSEVEAYALMTSGYRMTQHHFAGPQRVQGFPPATATRTWQFLEIEKSMAGNGAQYRYLERLLRAGSSSVFKVWAVDPVLKTLLAVALGLLVLTFAGLVAFEWVAPRAGLLSGWWSSGTQASSQALEGIAGSVRGLTLVRIGVTLAWLAGIFAATRVLVSVLGATWGKRVAKLVRWQDFLRRIALALLVGTLGFCLAALHLYVFDKRFLALGRLKAVQAQKD